MRIILFTFPVSVMAEPKTVLSCTDGSVYATFFGLMLTVTESGHVSGLLVQTCTYAGRKGMHPANFSRLYI